MLSAILPVAGLTMRTAEEWRSSQSTAAHVREGIGRICGRLVQVCKETGSVSEGWTSPDELRCCSARRRVIEGNA